MKGLNNDVDKLVQEYGERDEDVKKIIDKRRQLIEIFNSSSPQKSRTSQDFQNQTLLPKLTSLLNQLDEKEKLFKRLIGQPLPNESKILDSNLIYHKVRCGIDII